MSVLVAVHRAGGFALIAVAALVLLDRRLIQPLTLLLLLEIAMGLVLYVGGHRPLTGLHLVYAAAALLVLPVTESIARGRPDRSGIYRIGGVALLVGVLLRLAMTG